MVDNALLLQYNYKTKHPSIFLQLSRLSQRTRSFHATNIPTHPTTQQHIELFTLFPHARVFIYYRYHTSTIVGVRCRHSVAFCHKTIQRRVLLFGRNAHALYLWWLTARYRQHFRTSVCWAQAYADFFAFFLFSGGVCCTTVITSALRVEPLAVRSSASLSPKPWRPARDWGTSPTIGINSADGGSPVI
jgi:hypothetical protein